MSFRNVAVTGFLTEDLHRQLLMVVYLHWHVEVGWGLLTSAGVCRGIKVSAVASAECCGGLLRSAGV